MSGSPETQSQNGRRWDDPPESEPVGPHLDTQNDQTTMILIQKKQIMPLIYRKEVLKIAFAPRDDKIVAMGPNHYEEWNVVYCLDAATLQEIGTQRPLKAERGFAFAPLPDDALATPFLRLADHYEAKYFRVRKPRLEIFDFHRKDFRLKSDVWIQAPIVFSPNGLLLAAVSSRDTSRIVIMKSNTESVQTGVIRVIPSHIDEVTHLAFTPDGTGIVSLSKDGSCRLTSVASGRTLKKFEVATRHNPQILQVSPDGQLVASIWGRVVMLWYLSTGVISTYNLNEIRQNEGWPLCMSCDCKYLACRTEKGVDVSSLVTGRFEGEFVIDRSFVTAASFSSDNSQLVVGKQSGEICLYDLVVVS